VIPAGFERFAEGNDVGHDQRLAAGEDDMVGGECGDLPHDFVDGDILSPGIPTGVGRVAPGAAEVAAAGADKNAGNARELSFALNRMEQLGEFHESIML
jgi:hypothetical protein